VDGRPPKPEAPRAARVGLVTGGEPGAVLIDLGRADGLRVGSPLRFLRQEAVPGLSGGGSTTAERAVGDGRVQAIEDHQALVLLSRGSRVAAGDLVERSEEGPTSVLAPARLDRLGEAGFVIRPMLPLDTLGVAFVNEAWVSWTFAGPWYVEGRLSPVGLGWSQDGNPLSVAGVVAGGLERPGSGGGDLTWRQVLRPQRGAPGDHGGVFDGRPEIAYVFRPVAAQNSRDKLGRYRGHGRRLRGGGMPGEERPHEWFDVVAAVGERRHRDRRGAHEGGQTLVQR
jgi:hypothetical protein